jgi:hypothetical protein
VHRNRENGKAKCKTTKNRVISKNFRTITEDVIYTYERKEQREYMS